MNNQKLNLQFTPDDINIILEGLGNMPFVKVYDLITRIQKQAAQELRKNEEWDADKVLKEETEEVFV